MRVPKGLAFILCLGVLAASATAVRSQNDNGKSSRVEKADDAAPKKAKKTAARKKPRGRLPNYYGQVGCTDEQRNEIYAIQARYQDEMDELIKQLAGLREQRDRDVEAVLTDEQRVKLTELVEKAKQRREARKPGGAAKVKKDTDGE